MSPDDDTPEPGAAPPEHLSGMAGMDLVRRVLEEARGVARTQGKDVGRGRRLPPTRRVAGSGSRRRWSGPGPDARDPQTLASVTRDVAKKRGWSSRVAEGAVFGQWPTVVGSHIADHATPTNFARRGADRRGGVDGLGHPITNHPEPSAGQDRRGGRRRRGEQPENHRPSRAVVAKGTAAHRRKGSARHLRVTRPGDSLRAVTTRETALSSVRTQPRAKNSAHGADSCVETPLQNRSETVLTVD